MKMIEIAPLTNGAHRNQVISKISNIPEGWAVIPDGMETKNFPFGEVKVAKVGGIMTVTKWTPGTVPDPDPLPEAGPTQLDIIEAQVTYTAMMTDTLIEG